MGPVCVYTQIPPAICSRASRGQKEGERAQSVYYALRSTLTTCVSRFSLLCVARTTDAMQPTLAVGEGGGRRG